MPAPPNGAFSEAWAINNSGQIAGWSQFASNSHIHAIRWEANGVARDLGVLAGAESKGFGINERGDVVGETYTPQNMNLPSAFLYTDQSGMQNLGDGGRSARGSDVNQSRAVVGTRISPEPYPAPDYRGWVWDSLGGMRDVPLGPSLRTYAFAINDAGQVTGTAQNNPFVWDPAIGMILLGPGGSGEAFDINESGMAVGIWEQGPFVWDFAHGLRALNSLIATPIYADRVEAFSINNAGQILVSAEYWPARWG